MAAAPGVGSLVSAPEEGGADGRRLQIVAPNLIRIKIVI
jgi:hypothetical protein